MSVTLTTCARAIIAVTLVVMASPAGAENGDARSQFTSWQQDLRDRLDHPRFENAFWGIEVVSLGTGRTLFEHNAHKFFQPASNAKLFTAALVLDRLGPDHRIRTSVMAHARPDEQGCISGDLVIVGRGDPTFSDAWHKGPPGASLRPLADAITNAGIRRIGGLLTGDISFLPGPAHGAGWMWEDLDYAYGSPISALAFNDNTLEVRVTPADETGVACRVDLFPNTDQVTVVNQTITVDSPTPLEPAARLPAPSEPS